MLFPEGWENALRDFLAMANAFIEKEGVEIFGDKVEYITAGFIDGNLEVVYSKK